MRRLSTTELALISTVKAHLRQLANVVHYNVDEASLRAASTSLRYLLVENMLARAWHTARFGGPISVKAWCIASAQDEGTVAYCGGGEILPGVPFSTSWNAELTERLLDLSAFCRSSRIQVGSIKISTVELIQFVANTLGGAHFDPDGKSHKSRKPSFDLLRRLQVDGFRGVSLKVNNRSLLDHEILSIAEAVLGSSQVQRIGIWQAPTETDNID